LEVYKIKKIKVEHLKYKYPDTDQLVLKDLSFDIEEGEFIGIIGRNNAGKSTLCQSLVGLVPHFFKGAYGGQVLIDGLEVGKSDIRDTVSKVGFVFQDPFTQVTGSKLTVQEEIAFGLENMGISRKEMMNRIDEVLNLLDIEEHRERNPFELSGGQMQRMAIASIIAMKPEVIVLDEPTSQLDPQGSEEVFRAIQGLSRQGMTVVMVEHKMEKIAQYSDRVLLINEGELIDFDSPTKIFSAPNIKDYGIEPPVYTRVCQQLGRDKDGVYPTTFNETYQLLVGTK
jgi:energy-coupling factor transport system ATP-binding protein